VLLHGNAGKRLRRRNPPRFSAVFKRKEREALKKRLISLLLSFVLLLALIPGAVFGSGDGEITITFSYAKDSAFVAAPVELTVYPGQAAEYGIGSASTQPTVLDAVVAAHAQVYGGSFTAATAGAYVNSTLSKLFADSGYAGHIINGHYSSDMANAAVLQNGDVVETFLYGGDYDDLSAAFHQGSSLLHSVQVEVGETLDLTVEGFFVMTAYLGETWKGLDGLDVGLIDTGSGSYTSLGVSTGADGGVSVTFDTAGRHILATRGDWHGTPVAPAWCEINVTGGGTPSDSERAQHVASDQEALQITYAGGGNLTLPTAGASGETAITWASSNPCVNCATGVVTRQKTEQVVTLTAVISCGAKFTAEKQFRITVPAQPNGEGSGPAEATPEGIDRVMANIAAAYADSSDEWVILDMAAYGSLAPNADSRTSAAARQNYINSAITSIMDGDASAVTLAKAEIILRSIGGDTTKLYPVNSNTAQSVPAKLQALDFSQCSIYEAPWILLANLQGRLKLTEAQAETLIGILCSGFTVNGIYGGTYEWDGATHSYTDPDTTAMALAALAQFYGGNAAARDFVDSAIEGFSALQGEDGSFGNANSDAVVIIGLAAVGIDPGSDARFVKQDCSLLDGLFGYLNGTNSGFLYAGAENGLATEQGFRALIAALQVRERGTAFNLYDFSAVTASALRATGEGSVPEPSDPSGPGTITVTFELVGDSGVWLPETALALTEGATVYHALKTALDGKFTYTGASGGYISSITNLASGRTLAEFDRGENSGWLYTVNGKQPTVGLTGYILSDNDAVVWYYTSDYTAESGSGGFGSSVTNAEGNEEPADAEFSFSDVSEDSWYYEAVHYVYAHGLMAGVGDETFRPDGQMTRGMLLTVLYNMAGSPAVSGGSSFADVAAGEWYANAICWAEKNGLVAGYGNGVMGANAPVTREQMALFLQKYAQWSGQDVSGRASLDKYADAGNISPWALGAMQWAHGKGLIHGTGAATLSPSRTATRAEAASVLMGYARQFGAEEAAQ